MTSAAVGVRCPECARGGGGAPSAVRRACPRPGQRPAAIATTVLVGLNLLVYLVEIAQGVGSFDVGNAADHLRLGALRARRSPTASGTASSPAGSSTRGLIHIGFNMYLLWILGGALERYAGAARMLAIYFSVAAVGLGRRADHVARRAHRRRLGRRCSG